MIHRYLNEAEDSSHWGIALSSTPRFMLLQLGDEEGDQVRVVLTPAQAHEIAHALIITAARIAP